MGRQELIQDFSVLLSKIRLSGFLIQDKTFRLCKKLMKCLKNKAHTKTAPGFAFKNVHVEVGSWSKKDKLMSTWLLNDPSVA